MNRPTTSMLNAAECQTPRRGNILTRRAAAALAMALALPPGTADAARREEAVRNVERTVSISGSPALDLTHHSGNVRIRTHALPEIRITAAIKASAPSRAVAREFVNEVKINVAETLASVTVRAMPPLMNRRYNDVGFAIDFDVLMPERMPLTARNRFGNMSVNGLAANATLVNGHGRLTAVDGRGRYRLENRFGAVEATRLDGDVTIESTNGDIAAEMISGPVTADNRFGLIVLRRVEGAAHATNTNGAIVGQDLRGGANLSTTFGPIEARAVRGGLRVVNAHGDVHVTDVEGATSLSTTFGTVVADRVRGALNIEGSKGEVRGASLTGSVNVTTSFAPVILRQVAGRTEVRNSNGSVDVGLAQTASACDVSLTTTSGPIDVYVGNGGYAVAAQSRFGRVRADVPLLKKGTLGANWVSGTIGTGACPLRLVNTDGNITLQPGAGPVVDLEIQRPSTARPFRVLPARP